MTLGFYLFLFSAKQPQGRFSKAQRTGQMLNHYMCDVSGWTDRAGFTGSTTIRRGVPE